MIKIMEGNLFDTTAPIIAHQVNCRGVMGSGVAKQVKKRYPEVYDQYCDLCYANYLPGILGIAQPCRTKDGKIIVNLFGQYDYGYDNAQYTNAASLSQALYGLKDFMFDKPDKRVAMPYKIGCGRGGARWEEEVFPMIKTIFSETVIDIELWKLPKGVNDNEL